MEESWTRAGALLLRAIELDPADRAAFLDAVGRNGQTLRREVETLLRAHLAADRFLAEPFCPEFVYETLSAGDEVGRYRVLRLLGQGGMGAVYLAERRDGIHEQTVALKLVHRQRSGGSPLLDLAERRLAEERRILAALVHRNIARFMDGGSHDGGRPYFVMEFIDGQDLLRFCAARKLALSQRLRMFSKLCDAVHFSHRNLVIHGDLKPSNVLVDSDGEPKLLDFGVARWLAAKASSTASSEGPRPLSLRYASPEQLLGASITTSTDIYSLGVLLFELLTGRNPQGSPEIPPEELIRAIAEDASRPTDSRPTDSRPTDSRPTDSRPTGTQLASTRIVAEDRALARRLEGDLDAIIAKAMHPRPENRYASAHDLRLDIERHLSRHPVTARPPSVRYRVGRFVERHWRSVTLTSLLLTIGLTLMIQLAVKHQQVMRSREQADRVVRFLVELFEISDPARSRGESITARELLDRGAERIRGELAAEPRIRSELLTTMGKVYSTLGLFEPAADLVGEAIDLRLQNTGALHPETARSKHVLAQVRYGEGDYEGARKLLEEVLQVYRSRLGAFSLETATAEADLGAVLVDLGKLDAALASFRRALAVRSELLGAESPEAVESSDGVASVLAAQGHHEEAERLRRQNLAAVRKYYGRAHPHLAQALNNLAHTCWLRGKLDDAELLYTEALHVQRQLVGEEHPTTSAMLSNLAALKRELGELDAAEELHRKALEINRRVLGDDHPSIATGLLLLAAVLEKRNDLEAAEPLYRESLNRRVRTLGEDHASTGYSALRLGSLLSLAGRPAEAEPLLRQALGSIRAWVPGGWQVAVVESKLGACLAAQGRFSEAGPLLVEGYLRAEVTRGPDHPQTREARERLRALPEEHRPSHFPELSP